MQEEIIAKVVEWIQAMGRGEKIVIEEEGYLYSIKRKRNRFVLFYEHGKLKQESSLTVTDLLHFAQQQVKKEGENAKI